MDKAIGITLFLQPTALEASDHQVCVRGEGWLLLQAGVLHVEETKQVKVRRLEMQGRAITIQRWSHVLDRALDETLLAHGIDITKVAERATEFPGPVACGFAPVSGLHSYFEADRR